jgi:hypothetical protein
MHRFCTYCDQGYAARLLCLHASLVAQGEPFVLEVLCLDAETEAVLRAAGGPSPDGGQGRSVVVEGGMLLLNGVFDQIRSLFEV